MKKLNKSVFDKSTQTEHLSKEKAKCGVASAQYNSKIVDIFESVVIDKSIIYIKVWHSDVNKSKYRNLNDFLLYYTYHQVR